MIIKNVNIVTSQKIIYNGVCVLNKDKIIYVGNDFTETNNEDIIDGNGNYLIPGFVDIHCHGGNGYDFLDCSIEDLDKIASFQLSHGTTTLVPTSCASEMNEIEHSLETFKCFYEKFSNSIFEGFHLEGPFFSAEECGAQQTIFFMPANTEIVGNLKRKFPFISRISIAPEVDKNFECGKYCKSLGIVVSAAHTGADFSLIEQAKDNGYSLMTHLYSGMHGVYRKNAYRIAGAVEAGLYFDDLFVEAISDGKHLPLELLKYIVKIKTPDKVCMITDGMRGVGMPEGVIVQIGSKKNGKDAIIEDGVAKTLDKQSFAGSVSTFDRLYRTMAQAIGKDFVALSKMASLNPAKIMNMNDRGEIAVNKKADLLLINKNLEIKKIIFNGDIVK